MKIPQNKIKSLRHILYLKSKNSNAICVTLTAYKRGDSTGTIIIEKADIKNLANLNKFLATDNFWRAKIDVFDRNISETNSIKSYEYTDETAVISELGNTSETDMETRLNEMLDIRIQKMDLQRLQKENQQMLDRIDELENELEEAEELIEQMQEKIKSQQNIKSYVGLAGVALDALGLKNEVKGALAGFFDNNDEADEKPAHIDTSSGIIETQESINPESIPEPKPESQNDFVELSKS